MRLLKRQFGAAFVEALAKSPILVADLEEIRQRGFKIRRVRGRQFYSIVERMTIYIGRDCHISLQLVNIGHEKTHLVNDRPVVECFLEAIDREAFIEQRIGFETDAGIHEFEIAAELIAAGVPVLWEKHAWLRRYRKGGRAAVLASIRRVEVSTDAHLNYPEYYGQMYDRLLILAQKWASLR
ncbi:hypothetical protein BH10CYA1_BH10CYA1_32350 [soil metagenome]